MNASNDSDRRTSKQDRRREDDRRKEEKPIQGTDRRKGDLRIGDRRSD